MTPQPRFVHARNRIRRGGLLVLFFVVIFLVPALIRLLAEWPWFQALGFGRVFATRLVAGGVLGLSVAAVAFAILHANLRIALRGFELSPRLVQITPAGPVEIAQLVRRLTVPATLLLAAFMGLAAAGVWLDVLRCLEAFRRIPCLAVARLVLVVRVRSSKRARSLVRS